VYHKHDEYLSIGVSIGAAAPVTCSGEQQWDEWVLFGCHYISCKQRAGRVLHAAQCAHDVVHDQLSCELCRVKLRVSETQTAPPPPYLSKVGRHHDIAGKVSTCSSSPLLAAYALHTHLHCPQFITVVDVKIVSVLTGANHTFISAAAWKTSERIKGTMYGRGPPAFYRPGHSDYY
jgi:hypothetical protein